MSEWLTKVFDHPDLMGAGLITIKTVVIYFFLIFGLRLLGKREMGQMNVFDLILLVVLGNAVQNAMMNGDNSLVGGLIASTTLLVVNHFFSRWMAKSKKLEQVMAGHATLLVHDGKLIQENMDREGITLDEVEQALREHGMTEVSEAQMCVLEVDGSISVVPPSAQVHKSRRHFKAIRLQ